MKIITHGKCILAGEHAVIRGFPAVVMPVKSKTFRMEWGDFSPFHSDIQGHFERTLGIALEKIGQKSDYGFRVTSDIPSRAGLGSSAALSVAITLFLEKENFVQFSEEERFRFSLELENIFHGTSSGIDVAAVLSENIIRFQNGKATKIQSNWEPFLYLSDTGLRAPTKACVEKVMALQRADLDAQMGDASEQILLSFENESLTELAQGIKKAREVFSQWDLIPNEVKELETDLMAQGALAVKPTGSGDGGYLLSLWDKKPNHKNLFSIWADSLKVP